MESRYQKSGWRFVFFLCQQRIEKGDVLEVMQPVGKFYVELNPANTNNYLGFAAGSGITPVLPSSNNVAYRTEQQFYISIWK